jgi:hypothetical protein
VPAIVIDLTVDSFLPAVGRPFAVGDGLELELVEARALTAQAPDGFRTPFRLEFRGPAEPVLEQRIHRLEHESLGTLEIFLVPVGANATGTTYEAIFA